MTSATVSPQTCSKKNIKAALLIRDSYAQIVEDAARGQGEHLAAALEVFSCGADHQAAAMSEARAGVSQAVSAPSFNGQKQLEKAGQLFNIIDSAARNNCAV